MPIICCICQNDLSRGDKPDASAFAFPMDKAELQQWLDACGPMKPIRPKNPRYLVCEDHFKQEDFAPSSGSSESSSHKTLNPGACPMAFIGPVKLVEAAPKITKTTKTPSIYLETDPLSQAAVLKKIPRVVLPDEFEPDPLSQSAAPKKAPKVKAPKVVKPKLKTISTQTKVVYIKKDPLDKPLKNKKCICKCHKEKKVKMVSTAVQTPKNSEEVKELKRKNNILKQQLHRMKETKTHDISDTRKRRIVREELSKKYTEAQVAGMLRDNNRARHWCEDDVKQAYGMYAISPKAYKYMRALNLIMLPSRTILNSYARNGFQWKEETNKSRRRASKKNNPESEMEIDENQSEGGSSEEEKESEDLDSDELKNPRTKPADSPKIKKTVARVEPDPKVESVDPRVALKDPRKESADPRVAPLDPRMMDPRMMDPRLEHSDPQLKPALNPTNPTVERSLEEESTNGSAVQPLPVPSRANHEPQSFIEFEVEEQKLAQPNYMGQSSNQYTHNQPFK